MNKFLSLSIRKHMIILVVIMTIVPFGIICFAALNQRDHDIQEAKRIAVRLADEIANDQNVLLSGTEQLLSTVAYIPAVQQRDVPAVNALCAAIVNKSPQISNLLLIDSKGLIWASAVPLHGATLAADRRYFQHAVATGSFSSGEYTVGKVILKPALSFGYPIKDASGKVRHVACAAFTLTKYDKLLKMKDLPENTSLLLADHKGTILFSSPSKGNIGKPDRADLFRRMSEGPDEGTFEGRGTVGVQRFFAYKKLRLGSERAPYMYVRTGIPVSAVLAQTHRGILLNVGLISTILLAAISFAGYISKRGVLDKVVALRDATQKVARGDYDVRVADHVAGGELGALAEAFDDMTQKLADADRLRRDDELMLKEQNCQLELEMGERQKAQEKLRERERFLRTIIESEPECVKMIDREGNLLMMNRAGLDMIEAESFEQVQGQNVCPLVVPEYREAFLSLASNAFEGIPGVLQFESVGLKGRHIWLESHVVPYRDASDQVVAALSITRDITERINSEKELSLAESRYRRLFETMTDCYGAISLDGNIVECNEAFCSLVGYSADELKTLSYKDITPDRWHGYESAILESQVMQRGFSDIYEKEYRHKDGHILPVEVRTFLARDIDGQPVNIWAIIRETSGRKVAEQERLDLERQLLHAQKLESLGILAGGIAHDFNNLLTAILGNLDLALLRLPPGSQAFENIEQSMKASRLAADLTRQMLDYSGKGVFQLALIDLNEVVLGNSDLFRTVIPKNITLTVDAHGDLPQIMADPGQIQQVVMNLLTNAAEAIGANPGVITLETGSAYCDDVFIQKSILAEKADPGTFVYVQVSDNGSGMDPETQQRLFDPFFTTKFTGRGLGMAATQGIIRSHKGIILLESEKGRGTTFRIMFPVARGAQKRAGEETPAVAAAPAENVEGKVLFVDDEHTVRSLGKQYLDYLGFESLEACNGKEALELYRQNSDGIALVILDLTMPVMNGVAAFRELKKINPAVRIILSSGFSEQSVVEQFPHDKPDAFIQKPFHIKELERVIASVTKRQTPLCQAPA